MIAKKFLPATSVTERECDVPRSRCLIGAITLTPASHASPTLPSFVRQDLLARHLERHALRGRTLGRWSGRHADGEGSIGPSGGRRRRRRSQRRHGEDDDDDDDDDIDIDGDDDDMDDDDEFDDMSRQAREAMEMENLHPAIRQSSGNGFGTYDGNAGLSTMPTADRYDQTPFAYAPPPASTGQQYGYASDSVGSSQSIAPPLPYEASYEISSAPSQQLAPNFSYGRTLPSRGQQAVWETQSNSAMQTAPAYTARSSSVTHPDWSSSAPSYVPPSPIASFPANNLPLATGAAAAAFPSTPETTSDTMALLHTSVPGSSHFPFSAPSTNDYVADYDWLFDGTNPLNAAQSTHTTEEGSTTFSEHSPKKEGPGAQEEGLEQTNALLPASAATGSPSSDDEVGRASRSGAGEQADALHDLAFFAILQRVSSKRLSQILSVCKVTKVVVSMHCRIFPKKLRLMSTKRRPCGSCTFCHLCLSLPHRLFLRLRLSDAISTSSLRESTRSTLLYTSRLSPPRRRIPCCCLPWSYVAHILRMKLLTFWPRGLAVSCGEPSFREYEAV